MFVQHIVKADEMVSGITKYLAKNKGEDIAIVLDGYDEMSEADRKDSFIADIIHRRVLPKSLLVITSRPTASLHLRDNVDCRVEIVGFTEEDHLDCIEVALPHSYESLTKYLESNPTINALCYVPLNMTILLCIAQNDIRNLPNTQTDMYKLFIEITIRHFLIRIGSHITASITNLLELPPKYLTVFIEMAHFAFEALKRDQLVFTLIYSTYLHVHSPFPLRSSTLRSA